MRNLGIFLLLLLAGCAGAPAPEQAAEPPLHLYLLAGQSNMAGRGTVEEIDSTPVPRVFALNSAMEWGPAKEPLHFDKPDIVGVGPGFAFGRAMAEAEPNVRIGLIPAAAGGSSIRAWQHRAMHEGTQSPPWDDALSRTFRVLALEGGELHGIIWHQGESDSKDYTAEYEDALVDLVQRFRKEFRQPDLPFVAAQLAEFYYEKSPGAAEINAAIAHLPERLPHTAYVTAEGFTARPDGVHLDSASARELGKRYAEAMLKLEGAK
ncbi:MAG: sialate O-acetylesterase [Acidobacteria bacterium]|nr:sialate O-acetylesterase [Acidobacteriota bacterium]